jgi:hypothetical protein
VNPATVELGGLVDVLTTLSVTCPPADSAIDVVFGIDHSFSMGTLNRLENAVRAVDEFLVATEPTNAWHGLVAFNERVTHAVPLAEDPTTLQSTLRQLAPDGGTDIGRAMEAALDLLAAGRAGSRRAMVVLTDGNNSATGLPILDVAGRAAEAGVLVVTVCAGGNCDPDLAAAATSRDYAFDVADAAGLTDVFGRLARVVSRQEPAAYELYEKVAAGFEFTGGSPEPVVAPSDPGALLWALRGGAGGQAVRHTVRAEREGRRPVALSALVRYTMDGGEVGEFHLAAGDVEVTGGAAALPTAAPITTATVPPPVLRLYLPALAAAAEAGP